MDAFPALYPDNVTKLIMAEFSDKTKNLPSKS